MSWSWSAPVEPLLLWNHLLHALWTLDGCMLLPHRLLSLTTTLVSLLTSLLEALKRTSHTTSLVACYEACAVSLCFRTILSNPSLHIGVDLNASHPSPSPSRISSFFWDHTLGKAVLAIKQILRQLSLHSISGVPPEQLFICITLILEVDTNARHPIYPITPAFHHQAHVQVDWN